MPKYKINVPIDLVVELDAASLADAGVKAEQVAAWFIKENRPYLLNTREFGALTLTLAPDVEDEDEKGVVEVALADPVVETNKLGGVLRGEEWGA